MPVIRPGPDQIPNVPIARDPGISGHIASPDAFGAQVAEANAKIGKAEEGFGGAIGGVGAELDVIAKKLQTQRQEASDNVFDNTYRVAFQPAADKMLLDAKSKFPDGGDGYYNYIKEQMPALHQQTLAGIAQSGVQPSQAALLRANTIAAHLESGALSQAVAWGNNQHIATLQTQLGKNTDLVKSQVLSGRMSIDDGLKAVDEQVASGKSLWSSVDLQKQNDAWREGVVDAAIENKTKAGDLAGADALKNKYYGKTPKFGDSQAGALTQTANNLGIAPRDLAAAISYETGGRFDPNIKGGKGGNYQGLIQFGPEERAKYGVRSGMTFQEQLPAVESFLRDRGVKPGMGLAQIYSVINAGSLDKDGQPRWAASDGNGNIASHVQNIQRDHYASADRFLGGSGDGAIKIPADAGQKPNADGSGDPTDGSSGDAAPVMPSAQKALYWDHQFKAAAVDQKQADDRAKAAEKAASDKRELEVFKDIHSDAPQLTTRQILNDPTLTKEAKEKLANYKIASGPERADKTYGRDFYDIYQRVHAPPDDPNRITDPRELYSHVGRDGGLTVAGVDKLVQEIDARRSPEGVAESEMKKQFLANAKGEITGSSEHLGLRDKKGDELYLKFMAQVLPAYDAGKKAGKSPSQLLDPNSPDYVGKSITTFKRPTSEWFNDTIADAPTAPNSKGFDISSIKTLDDAVKAHQSGLISADQARALAVDRGWARPRPVSASPSDLPQIPRQ